MAEHKEVSGGLLFCLICVIVFSKKTKAMNILKPDFDTRKIPYLTRFYAAQWYARHSTLFSFQLAIALSLIFMMLFVFIDAYAGLGVLKQGSPVKTIFDYLAVILLIVGCAVIGFGQRYGENRKFVIKKYLQMKLNDAENQHKVASKERIKGIKEYWTRLDIEIQKKMIISVYRRLSSPRQDALQDQFLDILYQKNIRLIDLPDELFPRFEDNYEPLNIILNRVVYLRALLEVLD